MSLPRGAPIACRWAGAVAVALAALGVLTAPAAAEQTTLGVAAPVPDTSDLLSFCVEPVSACTEVQTSLPGGSVQAPGTGRIVAWWAMGVSDTAQLRVLQLVPPVIQRKFKALGTSSQQTLSETIVTHFPTNLPVGAGDFIGVTAGFHEGVRAYDDPNSNADFFPDPFADGTTEASADQFKQTLELGAQFFYAPVVSGLAASSGSTAGGEAVVISGNHLTDSTAVRFGSTPATSFTLDSNSQITAAAPPASGGAVDVTVAGPGGTSATSSADQYAFIAPTATVGPTLLDFGDELVESPSSVRSITLTNTGTVPVAIGEVTLDGVEAADYTALSDRCAGHAIAPRASCSVSLVFTPRAPGPRIATLRIDDNASDGPHTIIVAGNGTTSTPKPSNTFSLSKPKLNEKKGTATLIATVPGRGQLRLTGKGHAKLTKAAGGAAKVRLVVKPTRKTRQKLNQKGKAKIVAIVTYTPTGGEPHAESKSLTLKLRRGSR